MATERLQKVLARAGIASRRAAEEMITSGRVRVNGKVVTELGVKADSRNDKIEVDGKRIVAELPVYVVLHKPRGVVSTMSDPEGRPTVKDLIANVPARIYPIGRLDFATSGVLLATNDGAFAEGLMHPKKAVPKTYVLKAKGMMETGDVERWRRGVRLEDGMTLPAEVTFLRHEEDKTWLELTIKEGRNQQIRRMGEATGFRVMRLARTAFAGITSEGLRPGDWRYLSRDELNTMKAAFGVPQRVPSGTPASSDARARPHVPTPMIDAHGRARTATRHEDTRGRGAGERGRGGPERGGERGRGGPERGRGGPERGGERGRAAPERGRGAPERGRAAPERGRAAPERGRAAPERGRAAPERGRGRSDRGRVPVERAGERGPAPAGRGGQRGRGRPKAR